MMCSWIITERSADILQAKCIYVYNDKNVRTKINDEYAFY